MKCTKLWWFGPLVLAACGPVGSDAVDTSPIGAEEDALTTVSTNFSQNNGSWACAQLGACGGTTLGKCGNNKPAGCAITSIADLLASKGASVNPGTLNDWLKQHGGYSSGCLVNWSVAAGYGGLTWVGTGSLGTPAALKSLIDQGYRIVAGSTRFSQHWVALSGYTGAGAAWADFTYADPWDGLTHKLGDGWVGSGAPIRMYK